jgi:hypothetical protein
VFWLSFSASALLLSGCVIPAPHERLHEFGVAGTILDSESHTPIKGAKIQSPGGQTKAVFSDASGSFKLKPVYGWHGAFFIGPICESLLPGFDMPSHKRTIVVTAEGYRTLTLTAETHSPTNAYIQSSVIEMVRR